MTILSHPRYQQYGHEHELNLQEISKHCTTIECRWCAKTITGSAAYCCLDCSYIIHKECKELPVKIQHPFHPDHWLVRTSGVEIRCNICNFYGINCYRCEQCDYDLDPLCAISTLHQEKESQEISHFLHEHHLKYYGVTGSNDRMRCNMCQNWEFGPDDNLYGCLQCNFFLHESCAQFPLEIELDSFHKHPFTCSPGDTHLNCEVCGRPCREWKSCYRCRTCRIGLHSRCADFALRSKEGESSMEVLNHFSHHHPLSYSYAEWQTQIPCKICNKEIKGAFYVCRHCRFFIHKSCGELPQVIKPSIIYPNLTFTLKKQNCYRFWCDFCSFHAASWYSYVCSTSRINIEIDCANAFKTLGLNEDGQSLKVKYLDHEDPFTLLDQCRGIKVQCIVCKCTIEDGPAYCRLMGPHRMWLHKSCAEVLQVIKKHALHPDRSLTVIPESSSSGPEHYCNVCCERIVGCIMLCEESGFKMDFYSAFRRPILKDPRHEHSLSYFETLISKWGRNICGVCSRRCEFDLYYCTICEFVMHHFCLRLPRTVTSARHIHELSLLDFYLEDDSGEYYCDLCTKTRHPQHGVYYCDICELICHIECIISSEIEDKALHELDKEIADLEEAIAEEKDKLEAIEKNQEAVEKKMKKLETRHAASKQRRNIWIRKDTVVDGAEESAISFTEKWDRT